MVKKEDPLRVFNNAHFKCVKLIKVAHDSLNIIHSTLTENKDGDYGYGKEENSCHSDDVLHLQEGTEFFLQWKRTLSWGQL